MSGIVPGYNYDIFISYRQKDNKGDGWVSEFVEALKTELESTFKEEISVYFDINPHNGLLETHDVDESLKEKLKCLIFIPVISRTYCDPKAFAWEHEFKAFVEQASNDQFGLKVKLPNGNVASRVLPIIIYDLDKRDVKLFESVIGSLLRGVEFVYETAGVNRPLMAKEDHPQDNINKTYYRDQVNKVANTIKDVLSSLAEEVLSVEEAIPGPPTAGEKISARKPVKKKPKEIPTVSLLYRLKHLVAFSKNTWRIIAIVFLIVSIGTTWFGLKKTPSPPDRAGLRYDIPLANNLGRTERKALALSPDGEYLVYCMNEELNLMRLNSDTPSEPISGTTYSYSPFFSPDGKWIGFMNWQEGKIMKIPITGGNPVTICGLEAGMNQANWYGHEIIYADGHEIYRVPDTGGTPELLYPINREVNGPRLWNPQMLPDKKTLLFSQRTKDGGWTILTWRLGSKGSPSVLVEKGRDGRYLKSGHIAYTLDNHLYICKFNTRTNHIITEPRIIATKPVWENILPIFGHSQFDFTENGILVYYEAPKRGQFNIVWVDETGAVSPPITSEAKRYQLTVISSNAQDIVASTINEEGYRQVEIVNAKTGNSQLFAENAWLPSWSADNSSVYYVSTITGNQVFQKPLDLSTPPAILFEIENAGGIGLYGISSDGQYLVFDVSFGAGWDIGYYDIINKKAVILEQYNYLGDDHLPAISPDGQWIAYVSDYSGQVAIYVTPFPGPGQPVRVTSPRSANDISSRPAWAPDMSALYYCTNDPDFELWRINMQFSENDFTFEPAQSYFNGGNNYALGYNLEIHPNGDCFLVLQREYASKEGTEPLIKVIANWEQELESK